MAITGGLVRIQSDLRQPLMQIPAFGIINMIMETVAVHIPALQAVDVMENATRTLTPTATARIVHISVPDVLIVHILAWDTDKFQQIIIRNY